MGNHLYDALIGRHTDEGERFFIQRGQLDMSFREFRAMSARLAHALVANGLSPGDRVVVQAPKSVEMVALYVATIQAGGVFLPLNTAYTHDEIAYFIGDATPRVVVCNPTSGASYATLARDVGATLKTLGPAGDGTLTEGLRERPASFETVHRASGDLAALLYTSGTTGRSKGAMLTHENLLSNALTLVDHWKITKEDVLIHALPIFHTHGLFVALNTALLARARVRFHTAFDLDEIFDALSGSTLLMGVPTFYTRLLADPRLNRDVTAGMRLFISGSAPLLAETHVAFTECTGHRILERYGMTETNMITSNPYAGERRPGTVGFPLPGVDVRLRDMETGEAVEQGAVGMIEVSGPNVCQGYWQMPEKTAAEFPDDGFFITGDLGQVSDDGYLSIVGRAKDLIITGGYNVYPKEIEDVLNDVDGVSESAVFGVPDPDFGEAIIAAVVPVDGARLEAQTLSQAVAGKLARFKQPRHYELVDELPRNTMGKVQKNVLRDAFSVPGK